MSHKEALEKVISLIEESVEINYFHREIITAKQLEVVLDFSYYVRHIANETVIKNQIYEQEAKKN